MHEGVFAARAAPFRRTGRLADGAQRAARGRAHCAREPRRRRGRHHPQRNARGGEPICRRARCWRTHPRALARHGDRHFRRHAGAQQLPGGREVVTFGIRRAELRHLGTDWSAEAQVVLPATLGASVHVVLQMRSDPQLQEVATAALRLEGQRLELAAWAALAGVAAADYLPRSGVGDLRGAASRVRPRTPRATPRAGSPRSRSSGGLLALHRWRSKPCAASWQLTPRAGDWRLSIADLEIGIPAAAPAAPTAVPVAVRPAGSAVPERASATVDAAGDGTRLHGELQHAPLAALAALARWHAPQLPEGVLVVGGEARELSFDWSAQRPPGARLAVSAELSALSVASPSGDYLLSGLSGRMWGAKARWQLRCARPMRG